MTEYICSRFNIEGAACKLCEHGEPHEKEVYVYTNGDKDCTMLGSCSLDFGDTFIKVMCLEVKEGV